jgi:hypothetical protein
MGLWFLPVLPVLLPGHHEVNSFLRHVFSPRSAALPQLQNHLWAKTSKTEPKQVFLIFKLIGSGICYSNKKLSNTI